MAARGRVTGDREIIANMRRAYDSVGGPALDEMIVTSLEPMKQETQANALKHRQPHNPPGGHLDQGVIIAKREQRGRLYRVYWVSFTRRARKLAHLVEFGTAPHRQPNRGIFHPGARAFPFFRPAFEATKDEAVSTVSRSVWQRIASSIVGSYGK